MWINRKISDKILRATTQFPAIVMTGARQTGKTSLLKKLFPNHSYATLEDPLLAEKAENEPLEFLAQFPPPVIVDEIQYAPKFFRQLKSVIDADRHNMGQFILTGSQKFALMKEVSDTLAGRCGLLDLQNLSYTELCEANLVSDHTTKTCIEHLHRGFAPELWRNTAADPVLYYHSYLGTYLERDVRQILNVGSLRDFDRFIRACALRCGQILNKSELGKDVGIAQNTVNSWLSVLAASNQITLLEPYFSNRRKQLVKSPKLFFNDPGFLVFMLGLTTKSISEYSGVGNIWECLVFTELRKLQETVNSPSSLWFYNEHKKYEIDFILESENIVHLIEVKWTETPNQKYLSGIQKFQSDYPNNTFQTWLACRTQTNLKIENTNAIHAFDLTRGISQYLA